MSDGRTLQIFRDGRRYKAPEPIMLPPGAEGNLTTLSEMAKIVREDARLPDLRNFAMREIIGGEARTLEAQISKAYSFCRDEIRYLPEGDGTETIADLWSCMYGLNSQHPVGDCAIKSVALATLLSYLKSHSKPFFVAIKQRPNQEWFDHVFVGVDRGGRMEALDPTPPEFQKGMSLPSYTTMRFHIFKQ